VLPQNSSVRQTNASKTRHQYSKSSKNFSWLKQERQTSRPAMISSKFLHQIFSYSPHPCPLAIHIHGNRQEKQAALNATNRDKNVLGTILFQPGIEEEGEDQPMENIYSN
jgi:hypothetical protein